MMGSAIPLTPGRALTPNEKYAALVETAGYVPVRCQPADYIELLPVTWRAVNAYGIKIKNRKYDCAALNPLPSPALGHHREKRTVGGPSRPLRRHPVWLRGP